MSVKSPWESRVGKLLDAGTNASFVWSFKPTDSGMYGGQPRIDWIACDMLGRHWLIEVKKLADTRRTLSLLTDVTPGQRAALDAVCESLYGVALLAVGHGKTLYWFDWRDVAWLLTPENFESPLLRLENALFKYSWTGPKQWVHPLFADYNARRPALAQALMQPAGP